MRRSSPPPSPPTTPAPPCTSPPAPGRSPPRSSPRSPAARSRPTRPTASCSPRAATPGTWRRSARAWPWSRTRAASWSRSWRRARPWTGEDTRWLDLCAGPGGKAVMLGALVAIEGGTLDAVDRAPHRARLVEQATEGLPVRVHTGDARELALPEAAYDRVLVDAPCTGLGALRRRPEARWRRQPDDVAELTALQRELLRAGLERTRPGGVVTYATCSPHPDETAAVVAAVAAETGAEVLDTPALLPEVPDTALPDGAPGAPAVAAPPRHRRDVRRGPAQAVTPGPRLVARRPHARRAGLGAVGRRAVAEPRPGGLPARPGRPPRGPRSRHRGGAGPRRTGARCSSGGSTSSSAG